MSNALRCLLTFLVFAGGAHASDLAKGATPSLDAYFDGLQRQGTTSGSIAIAQAGAVTYQRSIGFATIDDGVPQPADAGTRYRIGAVSRLILSTLTMQLAESATLTLDNTVAEFFPDAPNALETRYRDLLHLQGGPADASNYLLLARVLEKVEERPLHEILRRRITAKLGLARTYVAGFGTASTLESVSYRWQDGWQAVPAGEPSAGDVAILSNAGDLAAIVDALFGFRLVTSHSLGTMTAEKMGLREIDVAGRSCYGERGGIAAFESFVCHFPDARLSIAWTGNAARQPIDPMLEEVVRLVFRKFKPPRVVRAG